MNIKTANNKSAFTLVELAIVLIIIGLITGGVVGAQSLIESSKIKNVITQLQQADTSTNAFKLEYDWIPGDFAEANEYWPSDASSYGAQGNKVLSDCGSIGGSSATCEDEAFWQHLSLAKIWEGFDIRSCNGGYETETPKLPFENAYIHATSHYGKFYSHRACSNSFYLTDLRGGSNSWYAAAPVFTTKAAKSIDKKFDDGIASSGNVISYGASGVNNTDGCTNVAVNGLGRISSAFSGGEHDYLLNNQGVLCKMLYFSPALDM